MILDHCGRASCVQIIESLREQVEVLTKERDELQAIFDHRKNTVVDLRAQLAAAQLQIARLKKALQEIVDCPTWAIGSLDMQRYKALATPTDTAALDDRLKEEANKWADMAMAHGCTYMVTKIRSMK